MDRALPDIRGFVWRVGNAKRAHLAHPMRPVGVDTRQERAKRPARDRPSPPCIRTGTSSIARGALRLLTAASILVAAGVWPALTLGGEGPGLPDQRAYLFDQCPRSGARPPMPGGSDTAKSAMATLRPAWTGEAFGSGLTVLADWLDAPLESGAIRRSWQASGPVTWPRPNKEVPPVGNCLVLVEGHFVPDPPVSMPKINCMAEPPDSGCNNGKIIEWNPEWAKSFQLRDKPDVYAECSWRHPATAEPFAFAPNSLNSRKRMVRIAPPRPTSLSMQPSGSTVSNWALLPSCCHPVGLDRYSGHSANIRRGLGAAPIPV